MGRLANLFLKKQKNVLNIYFTAGFPALGDTLPIMEALQTNGADMVELGMPYSDPLADGPTIQASSMKALQNGMTIETLFNQLQGFRDANSANPITIPVILMGYMNPVLQYGFEKFCKMAAEIGIDGIILPDLPIIEFEREYGAILKKYNLDFIFLVTPETPPERVRKLDSLSSGFLYAVSSSATTGSEKDFELVTNYLKRLSDMHLSNPILVGFGIKDRQTFEITSLYTNGGIIGSAYIKALEKSSDIRLSTKQFLENILKQEKDIISKPQSEAHKQQTVTCNL